MRITRRLRVVALLASTGLFSVACLGTPLQPTNGALPLPTSSSGSRLPDLLQSFQQGNSGLQIVDPESDVLGVQAEGGTGEITQAAAEAALAATPTPVEGKTDPDPISTPEDAVAGEKTPGATSTPGDPPAIPTGTVDPNATPTATPDGTLTPTPTPSPTSAPPAEADTPTPVGTPTPVATPAGGLPPSENDPLTTPTPSATASSPPTEG